LRQRGLGGLAVYRRVLGFLKCYVDRDDRWERIARLTRNQRRALPRD